MKNIWRISDLKEFWVAERDGAGLYAGVFLHTFSLGIWLVAMPFVIKRLSGTDFDVGLCIGLNSVGYVAALVACLLGRAVLDRFNPKRIVQFGVCTVTILVAAAYLTVVAVENGYCGDSAILVLTVLSTIQGAMTAMIWPEVMGWLSVGHEGRQLNRRLGVFNVSWSLAGLISPCVGGYLVEINSTLPLMGCIATGAFSFIGVSFARRPQSRFDIAEDDVSEDNIKEVKLLRGRFLWMTRIALLPCFICMGLVITQLPLLFKFSLGFSESNYGMVIMAMYAVSLAVFYAAGKTHIWHYVLLIFLGAQGPLLLSMLLILKSVSLWMFIPAVGSVAIGRAFLYSSHLYYSISGAQNRSSQMAVHEIILAVGFLIGSIVGGYLSDNFGRYVPYWFGFGVVAAGLLAQLGIWFLYRTPRKYKRQQGVNG